MLVKAILDLQKIPTIYCEYLISFLIIIELKYKINLKTYNTNLKIYNATVN